MSEAEWRTARDVLAVTYPDRGRLNRTDAACADYTAGDELSPKINFKVAERAKTGGRMLARAAIVVACPGGG